MPPNSIRLMAARLSAQTSTCHSVQTATARTTFSRLQWADPPPTPPIFPTTCGKCHENLDITAKYDILIDHPIQIYARSVHGKASRGGVYLAATCNDCHSTGGTAHKILSPGSPESSINHFNIPKPPAASCHKGVENDYREGIHGQLGGAR